MPSINASDIGFILGILGVLGIFFSIYNSFRKPQDSIERRQALDLLATEKDKLIADKESFFVPPSCF